jgi:hypothetical protein
MNVCRSLFLAVFLFAFLTVTTDSRAECSNGSTAAWFFIGNKTSDPGIPYSDYCELSVDSVIDTLVVAAYAVPFQKARCTVPDPPFGTIVGERWFFAHTGDRATGLEFDMGGCSPADRVIFGELYVFTDFGEVDPGSCQSWTEGTCSIQSCGGDWWPAQFIPQRLGAMGSFDCICYGWQFCYSLPPYDLYPADGATDVPLNTVLTWDGGDGWECYVSIGTDPACTEMQTYNVPGCATESFTPDFLQPFTTYYWTASWMGDWQWNCGGGTAVHSFTTGETVSAVERTTWGRVKALYR